MQAPLDSSPEWARDRHTMERSYIGDVEAGRIPHGTDAFVGKLRREVVAHIDAEVEKCTKTHNADKIIDLTRVIACTNS